MVFSDRSSALSGGRPAVRSTLKIVLRMPSASCLASCLTLKAIDTNRHQNWMPCERRRDDLHFPLSEWTCWTLFRSLTSQSAPLVPRFEHLLSGIAGLLGHAGGQSQDVAAVLLGSYFSFQVVLFLCRSSVFTSFTVGCGWHSMKATSRRKR
jgi:hypothetical protein